MEHLWTCIEKQNWRAETKYRAALLILGTLFALSGFVLWLLVRFRALSSREWMVCFIGYPVVFSWLIVFLRSCSHGFHDREFRRQSVRPASKRKKAADHDTDQRS